MFYRINIRDVTVLGRSVLFGHPSFRLGLLWFRSHRFIYIFSFSNIFDANSIKFTILNQNSWTKITKGFFIGKLILFWAILNQTEPKNFLFWIVWFKQIQKLQYFHTPSRIEYWVFFRLFHYHNKKCLLTIKMFVG